MPEIVQQGGAWGPMECSVSIDKLGKICTERGEHLYWYKGLVTIVPLAMVDDLLAIANCGLKSLAVNTFINTQIELKNHGTPCNMCGASYLVRSYRLCLLCKVVFGRLRFWSSSFWSSSFLVIFVFGRLRFWLG